MKSCYIKFPLTLWYLIAETGGFFPVHGVFKLAKLLPGLKGKFMSIVLVPQFLV